MSSTAIIWDDLPGTVSGSTPFGYFDLDSQFTGDAQKASKWACRRLGYPINDVELNDQILYANFEESVYKFSSMVNNYEAIDNFSLLRGASTASDPHVISNTNNINSIIKLAETYGEQVGVGGYVNHYSASIDILTNVQTYDLKALFSSSVTIRKIFHNAPPAILTNYDYYAGSAADLISSMAYGFNSYTQGSQLFLLRPVYEDILRMQAIELGTQIRRADYGFKLINNVLKLFPRPLYDFKLWFEYTIDDEMAGLNSSITSSDKINDFSSAPYNRLVYSNINSTGKQWIFEYFLALCKITLGTIRGKFQNIPLPDGSVSLDADSLRSAGETEKEQLIEQLKDMLEKVSKSSQLEVKKQEADNLQSILNKVPLKMYSF